METHQITRVDTQHDFDHVINADTSDAVVFNFHVLFISLMDPLLNSTVELKRGVRQPRREKEKKILLSSFSTKWLAV